MPASKIEVDFSKVPEMRDKPTGIRQDSTPVPLSADGLVLTDKQIRARIRRRAKRNKEQSTQEIEFLYPNRPVEEWDLEELAHGRPRNKNGTFTGRKPSWVTPEMHEQAMTQYKAAVKDQMSSLTLKALNFMGDSITNEDVDEKGKPIVPASVKADLSKFLIEHIVGKPVARIEQDVSVKLQGILGQVMVNPADMGGPNQYTPSHFPGVTMQMYEGDVEEGEVVSDG